jgi:hypothetical protein
MGTNSAAKILRKTITIPMRALIGEFFSSFNSAIILNLPI